MRGLPAAILLDYSFFREPWNLELPCLGFAIIVPVADRLSAPWIAAVMMAMVAGILDWRYRRIPNWLTMSGLVAGVALNTIFYRWPGVRAALFGAAMGLGLLLPFVLIRSLGAGDWKLAGALGACVGPRPLLSVLMVTILMAGVMALGAVIWSGRLKRTLVNIAHLLAALCSLRMPGSEVSLDDPQSTKIPFGVAMAAAVLFCAVGRALGRM
jgi:prepilin peptidase CpaA